MLAGVRMASPCVERNGGSLEETCLTVQMNHLPSATPHWRIGVDLGGTKIEAVALDPGGQARWRKRIPTPRNDYAGCVQAVVRLVEEAEQAAGQACSVGIGTPGAVSQATRLMKNCNSTWLNGRPLKQDLEAALRREARLANDANCFALAEALWGAGKGASTVFGVILGTGVGAGIVVDGKALAGANGIAGEWGHNPMPWPRAGEWPGPACYCGRSGCIETFLSGPALSAEYVRTGGIESDGQTIAKRADENDSLALQCLSRYEERLARALAHVINLLDPDAIVLGGGLSNIERLYRQVPGTWAAHIFSDRVQTRLLRNELGDSAGVLGAAWLW